MQYRRPPTRTLVFLGVDLLIFLALFVSYVYLRVQSPTWPAAFHFASGLMAVAITLFILAASFTMFFAARQRAAGNFEIAFRMVVATIAVWGSVVILLGMEWVRLIMIVEVTLTTNPYNVPAFGSTYFLLTGFLLLNLVGGLVYLAAVAARIRTSDIGACALFVHLNSVVWLFLFIGVYLAGADLQGL